MVIDLNKNKNEIKTTEKPVFEQETPQIDKETGKTEFDEKQRLEFRQAIEKEIQQAAKPKIQPSLTSAPVIPVVVKSKDLVIIEEILEEDLSDVYFNLPANLKKEFKAKGEETASRIEKILAQTKFKVREIVKLIIDWLKIIPGISKYFLEQEAKIKTDRLLKLKKRS